MDSVNFPKCWLTENTQNGTKNGKALSIFPQCEILSKHYYIWLAANSRDSRNGTKRDYPDFPAIPTHPIGGGAERERDKSNIYP